jgi:hypothetical protein
MSLGFAAQTESSGSDSRETSGQLPVDVGSFGPGAALLAASSAEAQADWG